MEVRHLRRPREERGPVGAAPGLGLEAQPLPFCGLLGKVLVVKYMDKRTPTHTYRVTTFSVGVFWVRWFVIVYFRAAPSQHKEVPRIADESEL